MQAIFRRRCRKNICVFSQAGDVVLHRGNYRGDARTTISVMTLIRNQSDWRPGVEQAPGGGKALHWFSIQLGQWLDSGIFFG
jgi:hypothetical protein